MLGIQRIPQDSVRDHPAVGEKYVRAELHRDHFVIYLNNNPMDPATHSFFIFLVIAIHLNRIAHLKIMSNTWGFHVSELRHTWSFRFTFIAVCRRARR